MKIVFFVLIFFSTLFGDKIEWLGVDSDGNEFFCQTVNNTVYAHISIDGSENKIFIPVILDYKNGEAVRLECKDYSKWLKEFEEN